MEGKHGHKASGTEVPRKTLLAALTSETTLFSTASLKGTQLFQDTVVSF